MKGNPTVKNIPEAPVGCLGRNESTHLRCASFNKGGSCWMGFRFFSRTSKHQPVSSLRLPFIKGELPAAERIR